MKNPLYGDFKEKSSKSTVNGKAALFSTMSPPWTFAGLPLPGKDMLNHFTPSPLTEAVVRSL